MNKFVFHVLGGAKDGGRTLTARARDEHNAMREANRTFGPSRTYGKGRWVGRVPAYVDEPDGNRYHHFDWTLGA